MEQKGNYKDDANHSQKGYNQIDYDCSMSNYGRMIPEEPIQIRDVQIDHDDPLQDQHQSTIIGSSCQLPNQVRDQF